MKYEEILEKLRNDELVHIKNIWTFYRNSYSCCAGCCNDILDSVEEAAKLAAYFDN